MASRNRDSTRPADPYEGSSQSRSHREWSDIRLSIGETAEYAGFSMQFESMAFDHRCPGDATCFHPGEEHRAGVPPQGDCWIRTAPTTVNVVAEMDAEWRERVYAKYDLATTAEGWQWTTKPGTGMLDSLAPGFAIPGLEMENPPTELSVAHGHDRGVGLATHTLRWSGDSIDRASIGWTLPPSRLCSDDVIDIELWARIDNTPTAGEPVLREASFLFSDGPMGSDESLFEIGDACVRRRGTISLGGISVGSTIGREDKQRCRRRLGPLAQQREWTLTLRLPQAFQVFYTYVREQ